MKNIDYFVKFINNMLEAEKQLFLDLAKNDKTVFEELKKKIFRLRIAVQTGNILLWNKILKDEEKNISRFIRELKDEQKIIQLKKNLA